ncbi:MAG: iron-sulfur cluster assembly scaffold protein, partial [Steroidobacteraceae bacterium]
LAPELPPAVRSLFTELHHAGPLGGIDQVVIQGEAGSVLQGVQVRFFWQVEGSLIRAAGYQAYGCPYTLAACEWLARALPGRSREQPWPGDPQQWARLLEAPPERLGRFLVIEDALRAAQAAWP